MKEKDYPHFCDKVNGKILFEKFIKDFNIQKEVRNVLSQRRYEFFNRNKPGHNYIKENSLFDHVSFWRNDFDQRFVVSQLYYDVGGVIRELKNHPVVINFCREKGHKIDIYERGQYNWHNTDIIFVLFTMAEYPEESFNDKPYYVFVHKANGEVIKLKYEVTLKEEKE